MQVQRVKSAPFGSPLPGRQYSASSYRYGFNGKENDKETVGTSNGTQDYGMRIYNPALGRFLSVDPLFKDFAWNSPYSFAENRPTDGIDVDGEEYYSYLFKQTRRGLVLIAKYDYTKTREGQGSRGPGVKITVIDLKGKIHTQFIKHTPSSNWKRFVSAVAALDNRMNRLNSQPVREEGWAPGSPPAPETDMPGHADGGTNPVTSDNGGTGNVGKGPDFKSTSNGTWTDTNEDPNERPTPQPEENVEEVIPKEEKTSDSVEYRYVSKFNQNNKPSEYKVVTVKNKNDVTDTKSPYFKGSVKYEKANAKTK